MKKIFGIYLMAAGSFLSAAAGPGAPGTLRVSVLPHPTASLLVNISYLDTAVNTIVSEQFMSTMGKAAAPFVRRLARGSQIVFVREEAFLISAGESLNLEIVLADLKLDGKKQGAGVGRVKGNAMKTLLPRMIDSVYAEMGETATQEVLDSKMDACHKWIAATVNSAGVSAEDRALLKAYEGYRKMIIRGTYLQAHPDVAKTPGFSDWYFEGFDLADTNYSGFANKGCMLLITKFWWDGRKAADPGLDDQFKMLDLLRYAKSDLLKQEAARSWVYTETREKQFSPALKALYPAIMSSLKPSHQRSFIDSIYKRYATMDKGLPSPDFVAKNEKGKTVKLSDYRGKMVVLDIWADWCSSCIAKLPRYKEIASAYKGKTDIVFLTIGWENEGFDELWKELSDKHKISGENNLIITIKPDNKSYLNFFNGYSITCVPRYIVIDKNGNFLNNSLNVALDSKVEQQIEDYYNEMKQ